MMIKSGKPKYQRDFRFNAPMHLRQHFLHAHLDKALKARLRLTRRTVQISKGDTVKVMTGSKKGTVGKVISVSLATGRIVIDTLTKKNARGKEFFPTISVSNVYITELNLTDKVRAAKLKLEVQKAAPAPKKEKEKAEQKTPPANTKPGFQPAQYAPVGSQQIDSKSEIKQ